jgi:hypothetical protein
VKETGKTPEGKRQRERYRRPKIERERQTQRGEREGDREGRNRGET